MTEAEAFIWATVYANEQSHGEDRHKCRQSADDAVIDMRQAERRLGVDDGE